MLYPLIFYPIFKERVWGGGKLAELYGKVLPSTYPIGESWEISDRPGDASVIANGHLKGKDLRWVMENHSEALLGWRAGPGERFPLLVKILDARQTLSLQVHPPPESAAQLGGDPKTELWYVADADPGAELYAGLKAGVTRAEFERKLRDNVVEECFHRLKVKSGDAMFLPSGRVHALGGGLVVFEVQQNSDTTFRVFDWNRVGLDGKPRELHLDQSLKSIDFQDFEPQLVPPAAPGANRRLLAREAPFEVESITGATGSVLIFGGELRILGLVSGTAEVHAEESEPFRLLPGTFCLLPASSGSSSLRVLSAATFLHIRSGGRCRKTQDQL
jgi:mannose-6-phosphate isomerase